MHDQKLRFTEHGAVCRSDVNAENGAEPTQQTLCAFWDPAGTGLCASGSAYPLRTYGYPLKPLCYNDERAFELP